VAEIMSNHPTRAGISDGGSRSRAALYPPYLALVPAAIVVAALYFARPVLLPVAVGVLFAFALAPLVGWLRRIGLGRILSVLIATTAGLGLAAAIGVFITTRMIELAGELPRYQSNLIQKIESIRGSTISGGAVERATNLVNTLRDQLATEKRSPPRAQNQVTAQGEEPVPVQITEPDAEPLDLAAAFAWPLLHFMAVAGIVVIFVVFILLYKEDIRDRFIRLAGSQDIQKAALLLDDAAARLGRYLLTQAGINAAFGVLIALGLWAIGIPNPMLWALIAAVLRFVPYAGVPLAAVLPVLLAVSVDSGWSMALWTVALFSVIELFFGQAIEPWLFGRGVGLSPLAVVVAVIFWTWLWGPVGLLLSIPLTMCLVVLGRHFEYLQFLDVMLGDRAPLSAPESLYIRLLGDDADEAAAEAETFIKTHTLCRYYDEIVLRALAIGDADLSRGALDPERALKIRDSTRALVQNLSDSHLEDPPHDATVMCIGGRGPLDEAAAMLLISLLEKANVKARLATARQASQVTASEQDFAHIRTVCVCYLDPSNAVRAPYLLKRIKRRIPKVTAIAALFGANPDRVIEGFRVVTTLDAAADEIVSTDTASHSAEEPANRSGQPLEPAA
jgi:predicted PurR-regulated permease PerM